MQIKSKKRFFIMITIIIVIIVSTIGITVFLLLKNKEESVSAGAVQNQIDTAKMAEEQKKKEEEEALKRGKQQKLKEWNLLLVNSENKVPQDYTVELSSIDKYREFDSRAISYLTKMMEDAREDGYPNIWAQSTYRSVKEQTTVYNNKVNEFKKMGYGLEKSQQLAQEYVNKPGYSEHNIALAVDFNMIETSFENAKVFSWLMEHGEEYGFILRYPKDKEAITKVSYEPWHWRYVGKENAQIIKEKGWCLEEYIQYLSE